LYGEEAESVFVGEGLLDGLVAVDVVPHLTALVHLQLPPAQIGRLFAALESFHGCFAGVQVVGLKVGRALHNQQQQRTKPKKE